MDDIYKIHFTEICKMYNKSAIVKKNDFVNKCATYKKKFKNK